MKKENDLVEAGKFSFLNENYEEAAGYFKEILKQSPQNAEAYYNLGVVYEAKNMLKEAKELFNKALEISPEYKLAEEHLAKLVGE